MAVVVEVLDHGGQPVSIARFDGASVRIGRAYDCDVVIPDPHVDPYHCAIRDDETPGHYRVHDEHTVNGTRVGKRAICGREATIASGTLLQIGKTRLRVSAPAQTLAPALKLTRSDQLIEWLGTPWVTASLLAAVAAVSVVNTYQRSDASFRISSLFDGLTVAFVSVVAVAAFWGLIGKLVRRKACLRTHASIAAITWLLSIGLAIVMDSALYNANAMYSRAWVGALTGGLLLVASQYLHMSLATSFMLPVKALLVAALFALHPGLTLYHRFEERGEFSSRVSYPGRVLPPGWHLGEALSPGEFIDRAGTTFRKAAADAERRNREEDAEK